MEQTRLVFWLASNRAIYTACGQLLSVLGTNRRMQSEVMTPKTSPPNIKDYLGGGGHQRSALKNQKKTRGKHDGLYNLLGSGWRTRRAKCGGEEWAGVGVFGGGGAWFTNFPQI